MKSLRNFFNSGEDRGLGSNGVRSSSDMSDTLDSEGDPVVGVDGNGGCCALGALALSPPLKSEEAGSVDSWICTPRFLSFFKFLL